MKAGHELTSPVTAQSLLGEPVYVETSDTAVDRFAAQHDRDGLDYRPAFYSDLIPLDKPAFGQQYAFQVDLDRCTGCKACVSACHSLNGLEEGESWRNVELLVGESQPYLQTITSSCHHCLEPACLDGCPVRAYEKDPVTGIVRHLDDQCIGCQYCTMKCPYDAPKYSRRLGIVRKCDLCYGRLTEGEAPACVQACPHDAIKIRLVDVEEVRAIAMAEQNRLPGACASDYTVPASSYISRFPVPAEAASAERESLALEQPHWPLIVMLLLTQIATGGYLALAAMSFISPELFQTIAPAATTVDWVILQLGLGAAFFHLGKPMGAWRFFLGLRSSWMSREILAFGILSVAAACLPLIARCGFDPRLVAISSQGVAFLGLVAVFTSVMVYADTRRPFWRFSRTIIGFGGTVLQSAVLSFVWMLDSPRLSAQDVPLVFGSLLLLGCLDGVLFWLRHSEQQRAAANRFHPWHSSAEVVKYRLRPMRVVSGCVLILLVGILMFRLTSGAPSGIVMALLATSILVRELIARYIFFAAATNSR